LEHFSKAYIMLNFWSIIASCLTIYQSCVINAVETIRIDVYRGDLGFWKGGGGLIRSADLFGGDVLHHAKHAGTRGSGGMPPLK